MFTSAFIKLIQLIFCFVENVAISQLTKHSARGNYPLSNNAVICIIISFLNSSAVFG